MRIVSVSIPVKYLLFVFLAFFFHFLSFYTSLSVTVSYGVRTLGMGYIFLHVVVFLSLPYALYPFFLF